MSVKLERTQCGFCFGAAEVKAACADDAKGWSITLIETPKQNISVYVTKAGKIRVHSGNVEWKPSR